MVAAWTELPPSGGLPECTALVELADRLRWSAPELVVQYAQRALVMGAGTASPWAVRARAFVGAALVRLGRYAEAVEPALAALRNADQAGLSDLVPSIRLDLAVSSRGLGEPLLGCVILRPVLENAAARPASRAAAVATLVGCAEHVGRRDDLENSLAEAERLLAADDALTPDARRMERALLAVHSAAYHRRYGETEDAVDAARGGLGLLTKLRAPALEGGRAMARLTLELVCALLDDGELPEAERAADGVLGQPVRAAAADPTGRILLALANRVHVPAGRVERGRGLLGDAGWIGERHGLDWLVADALNAIAHLEEVSGQPADALRSLRSARAAEYRQQRSADAAKRLLMTEFGVVGLGVDAVNSLLRGVVRAQVGIGPLTRDALPTVDSRQPQELAETDAATGLLNREGLSRRLQAVRGGNRPVALTLVRLDPVESDGRPAGDREDGAGAATSGAGPDDALTTLAGHVRDIAPMDAELARSDGSELAVLLPHTTRDEAEEFAATIRESAVESDWLAEASRHEVSISTGVAQSGPDSATQDADSLLTAARETLIAAEWDRPGPSPPEDSAPNAPTGHQEIRDLLAPLLGHPTLTRAHPEPFRHPEPVAPESPGTLPSPHPHQPADNTTSAPDSTSSPLSHSQPHLEYTPAQAEPEPPHQPHTLADPHPRPDDAPNPLHRPETEDEAELGLRDDLRHRSDMPRESDNGSSEEAGVEGSAGDVESISRLLGRVSLTRPHSEAVDEPGSGDDPSRQSGLRQGSDGVGAELPDPISGLLGRSSRSGFGDGAESGPVDGPPARVGTTLSSPRPDDTLGRAENVGVGGSVLAMFGRPSPEGLGESIAEVFGRGLSAGAEQTIPRVPEEEPEIVVPEEPDSVPPVAPGHEPTPEVPPPPKDPSQPEAPSGRVSAEPEVPSERVLGEAHGLGPVEGPEPRPPDVPVRASLRRDRADTTSIADLLTEALVAYQETAPEEEPEAPVVPEEVSENTPPADRLPTGGSGRHRMPGWDSM